MPHQSPSSSRETWRPSGGVQRFARPKVVLGGIGIKMLYCKSSEWKSETISRPQSRDTGLEFPTSPLETVSIKRLGAIFLHLVLQTTYSSFQYSTSAHNTYRFRFHRSSHLFSARFMCSEESTSLTLREETSYRTSCVQTQWHFSPQLLKWLYSATETFT